MENDAPFQTLGTEVVSGERPKPVKLLREVELDVIGYLDRDSLDGYQLVSRDKHELMGRHWNVLSLRKISDFIVDGRRHHISSSLCTEEDEQNEVSLRLRNSFINSMGVFYPTLCRVVRRLSRHYSTTDNYRLKDLILARGVVPSSELLSFAFDKLKASVFAPQDPLDQAWLAAQSCWLKQMLVKLQALVVYAFPPLDNLRRDLDTILAWSNNKTSVVYVSAGDAGSWITAYIKASSFVEADMTMCFVSVVEMQLLVVNTDTVTPASVPSICSTPCVEHKSGTVQDFLTPITMQDTECSFYVFKNLARKETLRVYVASALFDPTIVLYDGNQFRGHCHAYSLQIQPSKTADE